ncbi:MAG: DUF3842 family protein [Eubacteriales bacterium]
MPDNKLNILVIDGQGGRIGARLIEILHAEADNICITAVGTNVLATQAMMKAGADSAATGENPVAVAARSADIIAGPIGIVIADSLGGEVTAKMALSVARSRAKRVLMPLNRCDNMVAGVADTSIAALTRAAADIILNIL